MDRGAKYEGGAASCFRRTANNRRASFSCPTIGRERGGVSHYGTTASFREEATDLSCWADRTGGRNLAPRRPGTHQRASGRATRHQSPHRQLAPDLDLSEDRGFLVQCRDPIRDRTQLDLMIQEIC